MRPPFDPRELARLYEEGTNLSRHLREAEGTEGNSTANVLFSYDLQAGSYTAFAKDPVLRSFKEEQGRRLASLLDETPGGTILDAGTGEGTTLTPLLASLSAPPGAVLAFDISLSRLLYARQNLEQREGLTPVSLFVGALEHIPILDGGVDVVVTSHALEPNGGRERQILSELLRVARRRLILVEPSWELGGTAARDRIRDHGYVRGLPGILEELGHPPSRHELWGWDERPENQAALLVVDLEPSGGGPPHGGGEGSGRGAGNGGASIRGAGAGNGPATGNGGTDQAGGSGGSPFASPFGGSALTYRGDCWYSDEEGFAFPIIQGIPCLLPGHAVLATKLGSFLRGPHAG